LISTQNKAQRLFLITALVFGLLYIFIVPPFQVPDEGHHLYRAYHIAEGHGFGEQTVDNRFGGEMSKNLIELERSYRYLRYDYEARMDKKTWLRGAMIPLQPAQTSFADFPNVAYYVPLPYLVQAFSLYRNYAGITATFLAVSRSARRLLVLDNAALSGSQVDAFS